MELRDIEIFLTLAEELHFGRTAERLHVTQARVSQAIKKQERRIGAALFDRTSRTVTLTPIGRQLLDNLRPVQRALRDSLERAVASAQGVTDLLRGPHVANFQELITVVAADNAVCPVHDHAGRYYARPDIRYLPIADAPVAQWALIWRTSTETDLIRSFARVVEERGPLNL